MWVGACVTVTAPVCLVLCQSIIARDSQMLLSRQAAQGGRLAARPFAQFFRLKAPQQSRPSEMFT